MKFLSAMVVLLALVSSVAAHDVSLAGSAWVLGDGSGRSIAFSSGGRVTGYAGCNRFFGRYVQSGDSLRITTTGATRMGCFKGKGASDGPFLALLAATRRFTMTANGLTLLSKGQKAVAVLRRK